MKEICSNTYRFYRYSKNKVIYIKNNFNLGEINSFKNTFKTDHKRIKIYLKVLFKEIKFIIKIFPQGKLQA